LKKIFSFAIFLRLTRLGSYKSKSMSTDYLRYLQEHADEIVPTLCDYARNLAARKYHWHEGKSLPLGKTPEDIVTDVYVSYARSSGSAGNRTKGIRHFDPNKDIMLQLKGSIKSAMWALTDKASTKNERLAGSEEDPTQIEFAPTDPIPDDLVESADFARAVAERVKNHSKITKGGDLADILALFELETTEVADQVRELKKNEKEVCQLRYQLRQIYSEVIDELNRQ
jgi:hypothetical protein